LARWCAAQQNWDRIHYDLDFARNSAKLPGTIINGALKQHLLAFYALEHFGPGAWLRSLSYRFTGMDLTGDSLQLSGEVTEMKQEKPHTLFTLDLRVTNDRSGKETTIGRAEVLSPAEGNRVLDDLATANEPALTATELANTDAPVQFRSQIGTVLEKMTSYRPVEAGRLALFADAVMDIPPMFYDDDAAAVGPYGVVVAPPLFPIHALTAQPGSRPLSVDREAMGREGVCEIGRDLATMFGFPATGLLNGGNKVWVHSLVRPGETVQGSSQLLSVIQRRSRQGSEMLIFETLNVYETVDGRPLITERPTIIYRME
jgi:acyl dehydratase